MQSTEIFNCAGSKTVMASTAEALRSASATAWHPRRRVRGWLTTLLLLLITLLMAGPAFAQRAFSPRYQNLAVNGDIELIGNMNVHCDPAQGSLCQDARAGAEIDNNNVWMINVDVDADPSTFNSSTTTLSLPAGAEVLYAALYWSGQSDDTAARRTVKFWAPGQPAYVDLVSTQTDAIPFSSAPATYQSFRDVTALVRAAGSGAYTIANIQTRESTTGGSSGGGWAMAVAYRSSAEVLRNLNIFDGFVAAGNGGVNQIDLSVSGFLTPTTGAVNSKVGVVAYDGDRNRADTGGTGAPSLQFGVDASSLSPVFDAANPANNVFNSSISRLGTDVIAGRIPAYVDTLGLDVDLLTPNTPLPNSATSALFRIRANPSDIVLVGAATLTTQVFVPNLELQFEKSQTDMNGGVLRAGDVVEYMLRSENVGNDIADDTIVRDVIPAGTSYIPGSLRIVIGANSGSKSDAPGDDQAEFDLANNRVVFRLGTGANAMDGGEIAPGESFRFSFLVRVDDPIATGTSISNQGRLSYTRATLGGTPVEASSNIVTLTVAAPIEAEDDAGTVSSTPGGVAVADVLVNDTLDGAAATTANVTLSQVSANPGLSLNTGTGEVSVAPNTPAGSYTLVYQICERANSTNCDRATVTITVTRAVIAAMTDSGTVVGPSAQVAVTNVLANDSIDGVVPTLSTVSLALVLGDPELSLDVGTGRVSVAANTPAGFYTLLYQICEIANPTNCAAAPVEVTVTAPVIDAVDDAGNINGAVGGTAFPDVRVNDRLAGQPVVAADVTLLQISSSDPNVTLSTGTGAVSVAPGTAQGNYVLTYRLCENLNPTNCDQANVTVTVAASPIVATDDAGSVGGTLGGTAVSDVRGNDTLNSAPVTPTAVTLAQVSSTHPNITLDTGNGAVGVAAGTPAGTYGLVYALCEVLNPTNCDEAMVTVIVTAATIDAVDDAGAVNGASGGEAVNDVRDNDTLGGSPVVASAVSLTQVSSTSPNVSLDPGTGTVSVTAGTAAGNYILIYRLCETLNPSNCDNANVVVTVSPPPIEAVDDAGSANGFSGGIAVANVLGNDSVNGAPVVRADVTLAQVSSTSPNISLSTTTGAVSVAPGATAGTYTLVYRLCEALNPTNCDDATVTVQVAAPAIDAVDDAGSANGFIGGVAVATVLVNDTLDGAPVVASDVALTRVSGDAALTLDPATGAVSVAAGTATGDYTLVYRLCEIVNPSNCDQATIRVAVLSAPIDAVDDSGDADGLVGGVAVPTVFANDTLGNVPVDSATVTLNRVSGDPQLALDLTTGAVSVAAGTPAGTYTLVYRLCESPINCDNATVTVEVAIAMTLRLIKTAKPTVIRAGDLVRYTLTLQNTGTVDANGLTLIDSPPAGFTYVDGSLQVLDTDGTGGVAGAQPLRVNGIDVVAGGQATIVYLLRVGAGIGRGEHTNTAQMFLGGSPVSNEARATVVSGSDPDFEQALLLGTVFNDLDGNGVQSDGERGLAGVRLATVEGLIVETDALGRFHLEGIDVENLGRGRNFIVKVDPATLPVGAKFTSRNPLIKRITQGLPARFDFGVQVPDNVIEGGMEQIELRIGEVLFAPGSAALGADAGPAIDAMAEQIRKRGGGEVVITANGEQEVLAMDRALVVREALQSRLTAEQMRGLAISLRTDVAAADSLVAGLALTPVLGVVLFDTDRASIKPQYRPLIEKIAQAMVELRLTRVAITGHADRRASDEYNQALGLRRAKAVYDALVPHLPAALRAQIRVDISNDPAAPAGATEE